MIEWDSMAVVGYIARPHGLRGQVLVKPETDFAEERFRVGATLWTRTAGREEQLTISSARIQNRLPVIGFEGMASIEDVERLSGQELRVPEEALQPLEPGRYYEHQLVGCEVEVVSGELSGQLSGKRVGTVVKVEGGPGGSRFVVEGERGEILIPFAADICVSVDVEAKKIQIDPPEGLLELNETKKSKRSDRSGRSERSDRSTAK